MHPDSPYSDLARDMANDAASSAYRRETLAGFMEQGRRVRRRRQRVRAGLVVTCLLAATLLMSLPRPIPVQEAAPLTSHPAPAAWPAPEVVPGTRIRELSDQELFAFFPDRPLAVVKKGSHQELVFLDEGEKRGL